MSKRLRGNMGCENKNSSCNLVGKLELELWFKIDSNNLWFGVHHGVYVSVQYNGIFLPRFYAIGELN